MSSKDATEATAECEAAVARNDGPTDCCSLDGIVSLLML